MTEWSLKTGGLSIQEFKGMIINTYVGIQNRQHNELANTLGSGCGLSLSRSDHIALLWTGSALQEAIHECD